VRRAPAAFFLILGTAVIIAVAPGARTQDASPPPQPSAKVERVEVRLAQFDVVVRDAEGKIATGLGPADFEVLESGSPLEVVAVDEWGASTFATAAEGKPTESAPVPSGSPEPVATGARPVPSADEQRSIVLLFDGLNTTSALKFNQAKRAALGFVRAHVRSDDLVAVYQLDLALRPQCGFTNDVTALSSSIHDLAWMPSSSLSDQIAENIMGYRNSVGAKYAESRLTRGAIMSNEQLEWQRNHTYSLLTTVAEVFDGLPGRRILVYLSGGFPLTTPGDIERDQGGFTPKLRTLMRGLSGSGVAVYSLDVGDDLTIGDVSRPIDWRAAASTLGLDDSILTDIGLDDQLTRNSASARRQSLGVIAVESGGRLLTMSDLSKAFEVIQEESTRFYRLSCRVSKVASGDRYRSLTIKVRRPGFKATARKGRYGDMVPGGTLQTSALSLADTTPAFRAISLTATTTFLPFPSTSGAVPVVVVAEALGPLSYPADGQGGAKLDVDFFLVARAGGEVVARYSRSVDGAMKAGGADAIRRAFRVEGRLDLAPGTYELQAIVRINDPPQLGTWKAPLVFSAPPPEGSGLRIAGLVLSPPTEGASPLLARVEARPGAIDPFQIGENVRLLPATRPAYPAPGELVAMFWLRGLAVPETGAPKIDVKVEVEDSTGSVREVASQLLAFVPWPDGGHSGLVKLDLTPLPAGAYVLRLRIDEREPSTASAEATSAFHVVRSDSPIGS
jgi:VWFA-related protein